MKKILSILFCGTLLFGLTGCGNKKEEIKSDESNNSAIVDELNSKIKSLEEENNKLKSKDCRYTETYFFVDYYDYQGTVPTDKYIIVDKFQAQEPVIIKYNSSEFNINFEKGKNYEFTFTSTINNGVEGRKTIVDIKPTDKIAFDQIQESCYYHESDANYQINYIDDNAGGKINEYTYRFVGESEHFYFQTGKVSYENDDRKILITNFKAKNNVDEDDLIAISIYFNDTLLANSGSSTSIDTMLPKEYLEKIVIGEYGKELKTDKTGLLIGQGDSFISTNKDTFKNSIKIVAEICKEDDCQAETMNINYLD